MLVFNEGLPRSGKSYDTIKSHILPALAAGRHVYARLNGIEEVSKRQAIADYLKMDLDTLDGLLHHVRTADVLDTFRAIKNEEGEWVIPAHLCDSLCVIDECHTFYVASTQPILPASEEFFALLGQSGGDGVLMTQWYRRLHSSVRGRIERKNVFQKLTAAGMEGKYSVKRYHATAPDRFEKVTTDIESYDPAIFPMYRGYSPTAQNREVYKGGGQTVWRKLGKYAAVVLVGVALAVWQLAHFFGGDSGLARESSKSIPAVRPASSPFPPAVTAPAAAVAAVPAAVHRPKMTDGQAYVFGLAGQGRPRLAGVISGEGVPPLGVVEWVQGDTVADRLTLSQLRDLGVTVEVTGYGVRLSVGKESQIVTAWPRVVEPSSSAASDGASSRASAGAALNVSTRVPRASSSSDASAWADRPTARAYTPPELVPHPPMYGG